MNANVNIYNSKINTDNVTETSQDAMWSWFAKINNNFKLPKNFKLQLSGTYQSKTNLPINQEVVSWVAALLWALKLLHRDISNRILV
jgi:hypothetical protein